MGKGEVRKGFLIIVLLILGVAVLVSYLNNDGTGYASSSLRGSSGIESTFGDFCECAGSSEKMEISNIKCDHGLQGTQTCKYICVKGLDSCTPNWQSSPPVTEPDGTIVVINRYFDGVWRIQSCRTNCRRPT